MQRSLWIRRSAAVTALALSLAACAGDGDDTTVDPSGSDTPSASDTAMPMESNGILELGYILPESGDLAAVGTGLVGGVAFAISEINAAGGVLGNDVTLSGQDESSDPSIAVAAAQTLIGQGVDGILGAAASGQTLRVFPDITAAGIVQCSGSSTSPGLSDIDDHDMFFRTAPSDALQGVILAETVLAGGHENIAIFARADDYGNAMLAQTQSELEAQGATVTGSSYDPAAANFTAEVATISGGSVDAVIVIGFPEDGGRLLKEMVEAGVGPADVAVYGADGMRADALATNVDPSNPAVLAGVRGTAPAPAAGSTFADELLAFDPTIEETVFAAQFYDCTIMMALAAIAANSDAGPAIAAEMINISRDGTVCTTFAECKDLLEAGTDIDYEGRSSNVDLASNGEPGRVSYEIWEFNSEGVIETVDTVESSVA